MIKAFAIFFAIFGMLIFAVSIILIARKGKPFKYSKFENQTIEENKLADKRMLNFAIAVCMQSIVILLVASAMYFKIAVLYWIGILINLPLLIYWIKIIIKDKPISKKEKPTHFSWEETIDECFNQDLNYTYEVAKVLYNETKTERLVILKIKTELFSVRFEKLYMFDEEEYPHINSSRHGYWCESDGTNSFFDSVENAIKSSNFNNIYK